MLPVQVASDLTFLSSLPVRVCVRQPRLAYDPIRKAFSLAEVARGGSLHAAPEAKVHMLRDRYLLAQQRVQRNPIFTKPLIDQGGEKSFQELTTVDALLGADTTGGDKLILGMITQVNTPTPPLTLFHKDQGRILDSVRCVHVAYAVRWKRASTILRT